MGAKEDPDQLDACGPPSLKGCVMLQSKKIEKKKSLNPRGLSFCHPKRMSSEKAIRCVYICGPRCPLRAAIMTPKKVVLSDEANVK